MGATLELREEEDINADADGGCLFVAMSQIARGMEDKDSTDSE